MFEFVPDDGFTYALRVTQPSGILFPNPLPGIFSSGVVLRAASPAVPSEGALGFSLHARSSTTGPTISNFLVSVYHAEKNLGSIKLVVFIYFFLM